MLACEDCGKEIEPGDYRPLDLFRVDPEAPAQVYDSTKDRMVRRPGHARQGGRRFRVYDLCRRCAAEALRARAGTSSTRNGRKHYIPTSARVAPKRGGRPRLLTDDELRGLHALYNRAEVSQLELARRLAASREKGTESGYHQAMLYGWRRLRLPLRSRSEQMALAYRSRRPKEA